MDNSVILKSGWLYRRVNDTKWERCYVELYRDGYLKYYESDHCPNAEDQIFMPTECISIKTSYQVEGRSKPPNGLSIQFLFSVATINNKIWIFCTESMNDLKAWLTNLEESRYSIFNTKSIYTSNPLLLNQTLGRNHLATVQMNPLVPNSVNFNPQFNPMNQMLLSQSPNYLPLTHNPQTMPHPASTITPNAFNPFPSPHLTAPIFSTTGFVPNLTAPLNSYPGSPSIPHSNPLFLSTIPHPNAASYNHLQQPHLSTTNTTNLNYQTNHYSDHHSSSIANNQNTATNSLANQSQFARPTILQTSIPSLFANRDLNTSILQPAIHQTHPPNIQLWTGPNSTVWW